ncbi:MAG: LamG domain-containing protein, partial [Proteobacteria bacterium]|nr:LamG domain-containing protein [Pseudomonadota bacterium]
DSDGELSVGRIMDSTTTGTNGYEIYLHSESAGYTVLRIIRYFSGSYAQWNTSSAIVPINKWTHLAITYDDSSTANDPIIYVNGSSIALTESTAPSGAANTS